MVKVNVKFGKENLDVENSDPTLSTFQALLFSLTNVPPERQKIMLKGKMLKDDAAIAALKEGDKLVLMGSADAAPQAPQKKIVFEEDLTDAQKIGVVKDLLSAGLHNLGNTCTCAIQQQASACLFRMHTPVICSLSLVLALCQATWRRRFSACAPFPS